ncbi:MAG: MerR family transcriptional regulator [Ilumatobacteraceae bacterium]|nr:MerR family transcriptional regulator [Ilumatobacteraceae bacterium]
MQKSAEADPSTSPLPIGAVAALTRVATSTLRYYERRGLVVADSRESGRRRYEPATVRRVVFVQMLQDAGLSLDEIQAILDADDNASWKAIADERMVLLDEEIARLQHARRLLDGALLCRFDHPLDECRIMNEEIDRRLDPSGEGGRAWAGPPAD